MAASLQPDPLGPPVKHYKAYGQVIASPIAFDFLPQIQSPRTTDISLHFSHDLPHEQFELTRRNWFHAKENDDGSVFLSWYQHFAFLISADGKQIICYLQGRLPRSFNHYFFTHVLSFSLLKKKQDHLHATVVSKNNKAIAFLGAPGQGKSTMAAFFIKQGYDLVCDDLLLFDENLSCYPGLPILKLFPKTAEDLTFNGLSYKMNHFTKKRIYHTQKTVPETKISAFVSLKTRTDKATINIEKLSTSDAFVCLASSTFNSILNSPERHSINYKFIKPLAENIDVYSLSYNRNYDILPLCQRAIENITSAPKEEIYV